MSENQIKAAFSFESFKFDTVYLDFSKSTNSDQIKLAFHPSGTFNKASQIYYLSLKLVAQDEKEGDTIFDTAIISEFTFNKEIQSIEDIPKFFFPNSIAIVFPYIRAFVSTVSLQSNHKPLVMPTMNLGSLSDPLVANTTFE